MKTHTNVTDINPRGSQVILLIYMLVCKHESKYLVLNSAEMKYNTNFSIFHLNVLIYKTRFFVS